MISTTSETPGDVTLRITIRPETVVTPMGPEPERSLSVCPGIPSRLVVTHSFTVPVTSRLSPDSSYKERKETFWHQEQDERTEGGWRSPGKHRELSVKDHSGRGSTRSGPGTPTRRKVDLLWLLSSSTEGPPVLCFRSHSYFSLFPWAGVRRGTKGVGNPKIVVGVERVQVFDFGFGWPNEDISFTFRFNRIVSCGEVQLSFVWWSLLSYYKWFVSRR